ncbi:DUF167 domain-containing protein [Croceicoccus naphthovorans]|uniref:UPF0235 protein AB433_16480 n=1 Tax=Croceicoccus naphthovorans TaxID=1348774 RepID=A0A0G3XJ37_9SPHN|nr:DUF167 domain-containing protein [Croceicoccus naphthovorans]AKM11207.1 hypothetical protein AB433_16480 [Croceicoccus naphthovorans]MBB3989896.1 hypothetical protein [Croceicoccus naphthovorans]
MARAKPALPPAEAIRALISDDLLPLRVTPNAGAEALTIENGTLRARVTVVPEGGKANRAVVKLVAKALGIAPARVELVRGETARDKVLRIAL